MKPSMQISGEQVNPEMVVRRRFRQYVPPKRRPCGCGEKELEEIFASSIASNPDFAQELLNRIGQNAM